MQPTEAEPKKGLIKPKPTEPVEEQKVIFSHRIERKVKVDLTEKDRQLFKSLVFRFEVMHDGKSIDEHWRNKVVEFGGRVSDVLGKHVTHLVWSNGKPKTITKAIEYGAKVVTPLWLEHCITELELADEAKFAPTKMQQV